ncbi:MAG: pentapeptide repeat-containing protein, partial [Candidatus Dadabacteria bacterium]|nr:pentapeptide repeat-containing protein [Candidatus Dadabacteria bacterium]
GCDLRKVDLSFRDLVNVDLTGADLRRANLSNSNFTGVEFTGADLTAADLSNSIFRRADFTLTDLDSAIFTDAKFGGAIWIDGECRCQANFVYVANPDDDNVSVIDTATNTVGQTISVGVFPLAVAISPDDGSTVYVTNEINGTVSVIDTATNTVIATIPLKPSFGLAVSPNISIGECVGCQ